MERNQRRPPDVEEALSSMLWTPYERTPSESSSDEDEKLNIKLKKSKSSFDYTFPTTTTHYVPSYRKIERCDSFRFSYPCYGPFPPMAKCITEPPSYESLYHNNNNNISNNNNNVTPPILTNITTANAAAAGLNHGRLVHSFTDNFTIIQNPTSQVPVPVPVLQQVLLSSETDLIAATETTPTRIAISTTGTTTTTLSTEKATTTTTGSSIIPTTTTITTSIFNTSTNSLNGFYNDFRHHGPVIINNKNPSSFYNESSGLNITTLPIFIPKVSPLITRHNIKKATAATIYGVEEFSNIDNYDENDDDNKAYNYDHYYEDVDEYDDDVEDPLLFGGTAEAVVAAASSNGDLNIFRRRSRKQDRLVSAVLQTIKSTTTATATPTARSSSSSSSTPSRNGIDHIVVDLPEQPRFSKPGRQYGNNSYSPGSRDLAVDDNRIKGNRHETSLYNTMVTKRTATQTDHERNIEISLRSIFEESGCSTLELLESSPSSSLSLPPISSSLTATNFTSSSSSSEPLSEGYSSDVANNYIDIINSSAPSESTVGGIRNLAVNVRNKLLAMRLNVPGAATISTASKDSSDICSINNNNYNINNGNNNNNNKENVSTSTTSVFLSSADNSNNVSNNYQANNVAITRRNMITNGTLIGAIVPPQPSLTIQVNQSNNNDDSNPTNNSNNNNHNEFSSNTTYNNDLIVSPSPLVSDHSRNIVNQSSGIISVVNCYSSSVPHINNSVNNYDHRDQHHVGIVPNVVKTTTTAATTTTTSTTSIIGPNGGHYTNSVNGDTNNYYNNINTNNNNNNNNSNNNYNNINSNIKNSTTTTPTTTTTIIGNTRLRSPLERTYISTESQTDDMHLDQNELIGNNGLLLTSSGSATLTGRSGGLLVQSQTEALITRDQRRRERRDRRQGRSRHPHLIPPPPPPIIRPMLPDILHSHFPPPYTALSLTNPPQPPSSSLITPVISTVPIAATAINDGRFTIPLPVIRRSPSERSGKGCCGQWFAGPPLRALIGVVALGGVACALGGAALGATGLAGPPTSHLTAALLMIGVGVILVTISGAAWRMTAPGGPPCLGFGSTVDLGRCGRRPCSSRGAPHGLLYPEFQHRPPPPSYQASMQEYRLRLLLLDRDRQNGVVRGGSPPPTYRSHAGSLLRTPLSTTTRSGGGGGSGGSIIGGPGSEYSLPPSYRSRNTNNSNNNNNSSRPPTVFGDESMESLNSNNFNMLSSRYNVPENDLIHSTTSSSSSPHHHQTSDILCDGEIITNGGTVITSMKTTPIKASTLSSTTTSPSSSSSSSASTTKTTASSSSTSTKDPQSLENINKDKTTSITTNATKSPNKGSRSDIRSQNLNENFNPRIMSSDNISCNNSSPKNSPSKSLTTKKYVEQQSNAANKNSSNNHSNNKNIRKEMVTIVTISAPQGHDESQSEMDILAHL